LACERSVSCKADGNRNPYRYFISHRSGKMHRNKTGQLEQTHRNPGAEFRSRYDNGPEGLHESAMIGDSGLSDDLSMHNTAEAMPAEESQRDTAALGRFPPGFHAPGCEPLRMKGNAPLESIAPSAALSPGEILEKEFPGKFDVDDEQDLYTCKTCFAVSMGLQNPALIHNARTHLNSPENSRHWTAVRRMAGQKTLFQTGFKSSRRRKERGRALGVQRLV